MAGEEGGGPVKNLKVHITSIIHAVVYVLFGLIMLANIMAITFIYIDYGRARVEIQKRDATIQALLISGKVDAFIVQTHPDQREGK